MVSVTCPVRRWSRPAMSRSSPASSVSMRRALSSSRSPSGVSTTPSSRRSARRVPKWASSSLSLRETVVWATPSWRAAPVKLLALSSAVMMARSAACTEQPCTIGAQFCALTVHE
ncbi:hypothetical protein XM25_13940 [Devosia sp. H5989]|nr:hypothetical protein XM25_13940 [Devosia sp. H5989]